MQKFKITIQLFMLFVIFSAGCKKIDETSTLISPSNLSNIARGPADLPTPYNTINVFYFLPNDVPTPSYNYEQSIGSLLYHAQKWFATQMVANGYPVKYPLFKFDQYLPVTPGASVAMLYDAPKAQVTVIRGAYESTRYNSEEGLKMAAREIDAYVKTNGYVKTSQHNLVFLPGTRNGELNVPSGYFGQVWRQIAARFVNCSAPDKTAFAIDYNGYFAPGFVNSPSEDAQFNNAFGHLLHELAHSLNVGHNRGKASESKLGTALMSGPNVSFAEQLYLTKSDCAILNTCQSFNSTPITNFYGTYNFNLKNLKLTYNKSTRLITINGAYNTSIGVSAISYTYLNKTTTQASDKNADYDGISWANKQNETTGDVGFAAQMSFDQFIVKNNDTPYQLTLSFILNNGSQVKYKAYFYIFNGIPNFLEGAVPDEPFQIDNEKWTIAYASSQYVPYHMYAGPAYRLIDRNAATGWIASDRADKNYPQEVVIDCNQTTYANVFYLSQLRPGGGGVSDGFNFDVRLSNDGVNFWLAGNYNSSNSTTPAREYFNFNRTESFRYLKLVLVKSLNQQFPLTGYNIEEVGLLKR